MSVLDKILMILGTIVTPVTILAGITYELYAIQCFSKADVKGFAFYFFWGLWFLFWGHENFKIVRNYWRRFKNERQDH